MVRHRRIGGGGGRSTDPSTFEMTTDLLLSLAPRPPVAMNGICSYSGSLKSAQALLEGFANINQDYMNMNQGRPIT